MIRSRYMDEWVGLVVVAAPAALVIGAFRTTGLAPSNP